MDDSIDALFQVALTPYKDDAVARDDRAMQLYSRYPLEGMR